MKKILLLGTSLVSVEIVQTAKMMGCFTIVTDNLKPEYSPAKNVADEYWMINTNDLDTLEQKCKEENVDAVFAGVSEFNLDMVIELTSRLGLPCYAEKRAWQFARDKHAFKQKCNATGISVAEEYFVSDSAKPTELNEIHYPVVVKPVDGSGNKGLSICRNAEELKLGREKANYNSNRKEIVIEKYLQGEELLCFYYVTEDSIKHAYSIRVFKQPGYPSFVYPFVTSAVENNQVFDEQINDKCISLLKSIGCRSGIAWIQFIKDENSHYYALEMGHRLSAESDGKSIKKITGTNAVEWMLDTAMGKTHTFSMLPVTAQPPYETSHCVYFHFADKSGTITSYQGYKELDSKTYNVTTLIPEGTYVEKNRLLARIVFNAQNSQEMCDCIKKINDKTGIINEKNENMYIRFTDYDQVIYKTKGLFLRD